MLERFSAIPPEDSPDPSSKPPEHNSDTTETQLAEEEDSINIPLSHFGIEDDDVELIYPLLYDVDGPVDFHNTFMDQRERSEEYLDELIEYFESKDADKLTNLHRNTLTAARAYKHILQKYDFVVCYKIVRWIEDYIYTR